MTSLVFTRHCGFPSENINPLLGLGKRRLAQLVLAVVRQLSKVCTLIHCWRLAERRFAAQAGQSQARITGRKLAAVRRHDDEQKANMLNSLTWTRAANACC